jgi:hypothetical protein
MEENDANNTHAIGKLTYEEQHQEAMSKLHLDSLCTLLLDYRRRIAIDKRDRHMRLEMKNLTQHSLPDQRPSRHSGIT